MSERATPPDGNGQPKDGRAAVQGPCPNCGDPTEGNYCPSCGQRRLERRISVRRMLMEVLEDQFAVNATLPRTIGALLFKPGFLSREYVSGRIQRYIPPFRLYLAASVLFFLLLTFFMRDVNLYVGADDEGAARDSVRAALAEMDSSQLAALERSPARGILRTLEDSIAHADSVARAGAAAARDSAAARDTTASPYLWGHQLRVTTGWATLDTLVAHRLDALRRMPAEQALDSFRKEALQRLPTAVFLLLPVFAALLKLLYIRRSRFYVEHFVFGLHTHAFTFLLFTIMLLGRSDWIRIPATLWMFLYFYLALKRFYGQGWLKTGVKYFILFNLYSIAISLGIVGLLIAALLLA